jgi:hypothetical protein
MRGESVSTGEHEVETGDQEFKRNLFEKLLF